MLVWVATKDLNLVSFRPKRSKHFGFGDNRNETGLDYWYSYVSIDTLQFRTVSTKRGCFVRNVATCRKKGEKISEKYGATEQERKGKIMRERLWERNCKPGPGVAVLSVSVCLSLSRSNISFFSFPNLVASGDSPGRDDLARRRRRSPLPSSIAWFASSVSRPRLCFSLSRRLVSTCWWVNIRA